MYKVSSHLTAVNLTTELTLEVCRDQRITGRREP